MVSKKLAAHQHGDRITYTVGRRCTEDEYNIFLKEMDNHIEYLIQLGLEVGSLV